MSWLFLDGCGWVDCRVYGWFWGFFFCFSCWCCMFCWVCCVWVFCELCCSDCWYIVSCVCFGYCCILVVVYLWVCLWLLVELVFWGIGMDCSCLNSLLLVLVSYMYDGRCVLSDLSWFLLWNMGCLVCMVLFWRIVGWWLIVNWIFCLWIYVGSGRLFCCCCLGCFSIDGWFLVVWMCWLCWFGWSLLDCGLSDWCGFL